MKRSCVIAMAILVMMCMPAGGPSRAAGPAGVAKPPQAIAFGEEAKAGGYGASLAGGLPLGPSFLVCNEVGLTEMAPAVAYNSTRGEYLVVWYNDRPGCDDIRAQQISKKGGLPGDPFYISAGCPAERRNPTVAYNSRQDQYLVVWEHNTHIGSPHSVYGRRLSGSGQLLDTADVFIGGSGHPHAVPCSPAVAYAYTADSYMVVFREGANGMFLSNYIIAQKVLPSGALAGGPVYLADMENLDTLLRPALAYNRLRNDYLVVWNQFDYSTGFEHAWGRRVTAGGGLLGPPFEILSRSTRAAVAAIPTVGATGQYLVVGQQFYSASDRDIVARPIAGDGTNGSLMYLTGSRRDETQPAVAGSESGRRYLVTWTQSSSPPIMFSVIYGLTLQDTGMVAGPTSAVGGLFGDLSAASAGSSGDFLVVFEATSLTFDRGIYGRLWGIRNYLPRVSR